MIATLLFILFTIDISKGIGSERINLADDGTILRKGKYIIQIGQLLEQDFIKIFSWTNK